MFLFQDSPLAIPYNFAEDYDKIPASIRKAVYPNGELVGELVYPNALELNKHIVELLIEAVELTSDPDYSPEESASGEESSEEEEDEVSSENEEEEDASSDDDSSINSTDERAAQETADRMAHGASEDEDEESDESDDNMSDDNSDMSEES